jgi:mannose-6-phosphate isomerase
MKIAVLAANQPPERFYRGGARIDRFRSAGIGPDHRPEDWVGSTTTVAGHPHLGLTTLPDGRLLADAVASDPVGWLGESHVESFGAQTMLLVKLLDAGQRLPVHAHPDDAFSRAHLHRPFGKAEAWYILQPGDVHIGLREEIEPPELSRLVTIQDTDALLSALHRRPVTVGDVVYVPPGELHAIGEGVLLLEVQQPEDLSILLEWKGFALDGARDGHLGIGFDLALTAVNRRARSSAEVDALIRRGDVDTDVLPAGAESFFRLECRAVSSSAMLDPGFAIVVVEKGEVTVTGEDGDVLVLHRGATAIVPHGVGPLTVSGVGILLICRPPTPPTADAARR